MTGDVYTLGVWKVKSGKEHQFVEAWRALGSYFYALPKPPGPGTLVQSVQDSTLFYSFGPWGSIDDIQAMRADPRTPAEISNLAALGEEGRVLRPEGEEERQQGRSDASESTRSGLTIDALDAVAS